MKKIISNDSDLINLVTTVDIEERKLKKITTIDDIFNYVDKNNLEFYSNLSITEIYKKLKHYLYTSNNNKEFFIQNQILNKYFLMEGNNYRCFFIVENFGYRTSSYDEEKVFRTYGIELKNNSFNIFFDRYLDLKDIIDYSNKRYQLADDVKEITEKLFFDIRNILDKHMGSIFEEVSSLLEKNNLN